MGRAQRPTDIATGLLAAPGIGGLGGEELEGAETDTEQFRERVAALDPATLVDFALSIGAMGVTADEFEMELAAVEGEGMPIEEEVPEVTPEEV